MARKPRKAALVKAPLTTKGVPPDLTPAMLALPADELQLHADDEKLRIVGVVIDAFRRFEVDMGSEGGAAEVIYKLALEVDDLKRGLTRDRRKWTAEMNEGLHRVVMEVAAGGPIREAIFDELFEHRRSFDFIPASVASREAIKSQFKKIDRLLKEARAAYRPYSDAEKRAIRRLIRDLDDA
jgi:hypothetical protein